MPDESTASRWTRIDPPAMARPGNRVYYQHADGRLCFRVAAAGPGLSCTARGFATFAPQVPAEEFE